MRQLKIFVASPSDVGEERKYAEQVIEDFNRTVSDNFDVSLRSILWERVSPDLGDPQDLINEQADQADLVVVIFGERLGSPAREYPSGTAEELSIAYKRWLEKTGRPRVWVYFRTIADGKKRDPGPELQRLLNFRQWFREKRIGLSVDFDDPKDFRYQLVIHLYQMIVEALLPSPKDGKATDSFGMLSTVSGVARRGIGDLSSLRLYLEAHELLTGEVVINPRRAPLSIYSQGLSTVQKRFWTTAFLDSSYWDGTDPALLQQNQEMLSRVKANGGSARRLLIGSMPPEREAQWLLTQWRHMEEFGLKGHLAEKRRNFQFLRDSMLDLSSKGFETKVGFDEGADTAYHRSFIQVDGQEFDPTKFGLTLYDDMRLDIFQEGRMGVMGSVSCFTPASPSFDVLRDKAQNYFESLWAHAIDFNDFLAQLEPNAAND